MKLIIAPHADDEVLGCSSILDQNAYVLYCGIEENHIIPRDERVQEIDRVSKFFGFSWEVTDFSNCNSYSIFQFIDIFQALINRVKPSAVFIPYPSYNQDHQVINKAALVALRPHDKNHFVRFVAAYEETDSLWGCEPPKVNYFMPLNLERKLQGYSFHASQIRPHRSFDALTAHARLRGFMCGYQYAEGFVIERLVP